MNWNISAWCIRNPIPSIILFLLLSVAGVLSLISLGIEEQPNIDVPWVSVTVSQNGAAPAELETQITRRVEDARIFGAGAEARAPMAIAVVGGLFMSTILTLLVVPVVFTYMDDFQKFIMRMFKHPESDDTADSVSAFVRSPDPEVCNRR